MCGKFVWLWYHRVAINHNGQMVALTLLTGEIRWELKTCSPLNDRMRLFGYGNIEWQ
jgi:hypothetical protein